MAVFYCKAGRQLSYLRMTYFVFHVCWYHLDLWGSIWSSLANSQSHICKELFSKGQQSNCDFRVWLHYEQWFLISLVTRAMIFLLFMTSSSFKQKTQLPFSINVDSLAPNKADNFIWSSSYRNSFFEILPQRHYPIASNNQLQRAPRKHLCSSLFWDSDSSGTLAQK